MKRFLTGKIAKLFHLAGIILLAASFIWWWQTFGINADYLKCLAIDTGICRLGVFAGLTGGTRYNPLVFWVAVACIIVGFVIKTLGKK